MKHASLLALLFALHAGCRKPGDSYIRVAYSQENNAPPISGGSVIVGPETMNVGTLEAGDSRAGTFRAQDSLAGIIVLLQRDGKQLEWVSDLAIQPGVGYEVVVTVNAAGEFTERSCVRPCSLD